MQEQRQFRGVPDQKNRKIKEQAVAFYAEHNVTGALETLLNKMFLDEPEDVYGYMSEYFHGLSKKPVISSVEGWHELDEEGLPSLALRLHCKINGVAKPVCTYTHPIKKLGEEKKGQQMSPPRNHQSKHSLSKTNMTSPAKNEEHIEGEMDGIQAEVPADLEQQTYPSALECLDNLKDCIHGLSPRDQVALDNMISQISSPQDEPKQVNPTTQSALSCLAAVAASTLTDTPTFLHLHNVFNTSRERLSVPLPVMTVINGGQSGAGKLNVRSFCISPSPSVDIADGAKHVISMYKQIGIQLSAKHGPSGMATMPNGAYCMAADKPEQVLELLKESANHAGLELNKELSVYIDVGAEAQYDPDKKKYEIISGQWKTADELVALYSSLLGSYSGLIGFIDPIHPQDVNGWSTLVERIGDKCILISDSTTTELFLKTKPDCSTNGGTSETQQDTVPFITCCSLPYNDSLVSDYFANARKLKGNCQYQMLSVKGSQTIHSLRLMVEMGVALKCKFVKLCAPAGLVSTVALSQLVQLQKQLETKSLYRPQSALLFSCVAQK